MHRHLARDGGPRDRGDAHPGAQLLGEAGGECPGQDGEVAVIIGLHTLGEGDHVHSRAQQGGQLLACPLNPERVDPAHHELDPLEGPRRVLQLVGGHPLGHLQTQVRVDARFLDGCDDLPVEVGADETHLVAVVGQGGGQGGGHDSRAKHGDDCHGSFFLALPCADRLVFPTLVGTAGENPWELGRGSAHGLRRTGLIRRHPTRGGGVTGV